MWRARSPLPSTSAELQVETVLRDRAYQLLATVSSHTAKRIVGSVFRESHIALRISINWHQMLRLGWLWMQEGAKKAQRELWLTMVLIDLTLTWIVMMRKWCLLSVTLPLCPLVQSIIAKQCTTIIRMGSSKPISQPRSTRVTKFFLQIAIQTICSTLSLVVQRTLLSFQISTLFKKNNLRNAPCLMMTKRSTLIMMIITRPMENFAKTFQQGNVGDFKHTTILSNSY